MKKELIIIGAGGYAKSVLDSFDPQQYDFKGFLDERPDKEEHFGYPILAHSLEDIPHPENFSFFSPAEAIQSERSGSIGSMRSERISPLSGIPQLLSPLWRKLAKAVLSEKWLS